MNREEAEKPGKREQALIARREHILNSAIRCFLENGYHQTGVRDIAKRAEVSLGNLYNHFPGKHDMLVGIASLESNEVQPFIKMLAAEGTAQEILSNFIRAYASYAGTKDVSILTLEITAEAIRKPDIASMFLDIRKSLATALLLVISRGVEQEIYRASANTPETANFILDLIENAALRKLIEGENWEISLNELEEFILTSLSAIH